MWYPPGGWMSSGGTPTMVNHVFEYLYAAETETPERVALEFMGQKITFGTLGLNARKLAAGLSKQGIAKGSSIGLMLPNIPQFPEALYGAWLNGNVVVP